MLSLHVFSVCVFFNIIITIIFSWARRKEDKPKYIYVYIESLVRKMFKQYKQDIFFFCILFCFSMTPKDEIFIRLFIYSLFSL